MGGSIAAAADTDIVHENVETAIAGERLLDDARAVVGFRDVGGQRGYGRRRGSFARDLVGCDLIGRLLRPLGNPVHAEHGRPLAGEQLRNGGAIADRFTRRLSGADDDGDLSCNTFGHLESLACETPSLATAAPNANALAPLVPPCNYSAIGAAEICRFRTKR